MCLGTGFEVTDWVYLDFGFDTDWSPIRMRLGTGFEVTDWVGCVGSGPRAATGRSR